jgi:hypothetical protein
MNQRWVWANAVKCGIECVAGALCFMYWEMQYAPVTMECAIEIVCSIAEDITRRTPRCMAISFCICVLFLATSGLFIGNVYDDDTTRLCIATLVPLAFSAARFLYNACHTDTIRQRLDQFQNIEDLQAAATARSDKLEGIVLDRHGKVKGIVLDRHGEVLTSSCEFVPSFAGSVKTPPTRHVNSERDIVPDRQSVTSSALFSSTNGHPAYLSIAVNVSHIKVDDATRRASDIQGVKEYRGMDDDDVDATTDTGRPGSLLSPPTTLPTKTRKFVFNGRS